MSERDLDAEFERIIAGWDDEAPDPLPRDRPGTAATGSDAGRDAGRDAGGVTDGDTEGDAEGDADRPGADPAAASAAGAAEAPGDDAMTDAVRPGLPTDAGPGPGGVTDAPAAGGSAGLLELPIAPTTSHAWRGGPPRRDDADALLDAVDPDDEHFVPPSEIELPSAETDPMFWAIVGGLVGGPLLLLYLLFFDRDGSGWWVATALAMVVVGFVLLVLRGGNERDPFDDGTRV